MKLNIKMYSILLKSGHKKLPYLRKVKSHLHKMSIGKSVIGTVFVCPKITICIGNMININGDEFQQELVI